jgi:hypothetical protein
MDLAGLALGFAQPDLGMAAEEQRSTPGWISRQRNSPRAPAEELAPRAGESVGVMALMAGGDDGEERAGGGAGC